MMLEDVVEAEGKRPISRKVSQTENLTIPHCQELSSPGEQKRLFTPNVSMISDESLVEGGKFAVCGGFCL